MGMHALDRKLLRDFQRLWRQALAIALVLACGVSILLTSYGMHRALQETRSGYYERNRFADVFTSARRVPNSVAEDIRAIPGVRAVETRITGYAILDLPEFPKTVVGRILSLPPDGPARLNVPLLRTGRLPDPDAPNEVAVNEPFALAHGFRAGDTFLANLSGQKRPLTITGTVMSPEFIYTIGPGALMPDNTTFGILWLPQVAAASAFDMTGAFNDVTLKLEPNTPTQPVIDALDTLLDPYGTLGAFDRSRHMSDGFIDAEITQLRSMAMILPPIFFAISAFLVSMVMGRIVALERSEIGLLKAVGYTNTEVCLHYLMLAGLIAVVGIGIGWIAGAWLARLLAIQYAEFFNFPYLIFAMSPWVYAASGLAALLTTTLGALRAALRAATLAPAIAMQAPAPPNFKRSFIDRAMARARISQPTIMILRSFIRWPLRSFMTLLGLSMAVATVVSPSFFDASLDKIVDSAFYETNRQDAMLVFTHDMPESTLETARALPGVLQAEGQQYAMAILRNGQRFKRISIEARRPGTDLSRIIDADGRPVTVPPGGIVLSDRLADQLDVQAGDTVQAEILGGRSEVYALTVAGRVTQHFGIGAYMDLEYLNALRRQSTRISVANVTLDTTQLDGLHAALKEIPNLASVVMMTDTRRAFTDTIAENVTVMNLIYIVIAVLITVGVAYNSARIQLSERARELASLRILGFTRGEVSYILIGETMLLAVLAQPLGWAFGAWIAAAMSTSFSSDLYNVPLVLPPEIFAKASLVVLAASFGSVMIVRRRLDRQDLVAVMKTRE